MASPFRFFRKHQKAFLVVAGVLAMFIFVFADLFTSFVRQPGGRSPNAVVTSWDGGKLTSQEMNLLYQRRWFLHEFLSNLYQLGQYRVESAGGTPTPPSVPGFFLNPNEKSSNVVARCVNERVLANQAEKVGMAVSDDLINHYLYEVGFRQIGDQDISNILTGMRRFDMRTSEEMLFRGLRELLLGNLYMASVSGSVLSVPPEQLWGDWRKVSDRISVEAAVLPVEGFIDQVPEPSEGQLIGFYEQNKNRVSGSMVNMGGVPMPSPKPGFRIPRKVKLKYLLGDVTAWTQELLASVTDEEIADYYERNKRTQFVKLASETEAVSDEAAEENTEEGSDDTSNNDSSEPADPTAQQPTEDRSTEATDASVEEEEEEEESAGESDSTEEQPAEGESTSDASKADEQIDEEDAAEEDNEVEYEPLEKVSDEIRRALANDKAVLELKGLMESAFGDLTTVYNRYGGELVEARSEERDPPPPPPRLADLSTMAKEKKLISEETVLLSAREMSETLVGKAVDAQTSKRAVTQAAFSDLRLYEPLLAQDLDGYWYLVVKVEDEPSRIPELEEVRDQVVAAWKRSEAAQLALEKSDELAQEAQESGKSLKAFFTDNDQEVVTTDLFSWFSFGNTPVEMRRGPRLGDAPPLTAVDDSFMRKAFEMKSEDVFALLNFDHSNAYVVKLASRERTEEELRTAFLSEVNNSQAVQVLLAIRRQNAQQVLINQVLQRVNLDNQSLQSYLEATSGQ